jgi:hypothetical protein
MQRAHVGNQKVEKCNQSFSDLLSLIFLINSSLPRENSTAQHNKHD